MTYGEWCEQVAKLVRESGADTVITAEAIGRGPVNYLDEPLINWFEDITPQQAANEIIRRVGTLKRA
jgi:hypothetical protein